MEQKLRRDSNMGKNLKRLRKEHKLSQEMLCAKLQLRGYDIGRSSYAKYECCELNIPISLIVLLKDLYDCDYAEFFKGLGG